MQQLRDISTILNTFDTIVELLGRIDAHRLNRIDATSKYVQLRGAENRIKTLNKHVEAEIARLTEELAYVRANSPMKRTKV